MNLRMMAKVLFEFLQGVLGQQELLIDLMMVR